MQKIENRCCECATGGYPCRGRFCPLRRVEVHYCDKCGEKLDPSDVTDLQDGVELCEACRVEEESA